MCSCCLIAFRASPSLRSLAELRIPVGVAVALRGFAVALQTVTHLLSFRHSVKWPLAAAAAARQLRIRRPSRQSACISIRARMPLRLAGLSGQAPQPRERCAEGAGLDGAGADRTTIWRTEMMSESSRTGVSVDLPEVTAFSSRFDAGDRRRIGEVGARRSHPHSRRRTESRAHQAGSLARVPPRPSLTGDLTAVAEGTA
jgi:hypothetical protein